MNQEKKIPDCPVEMTLQLIGDKWKVLIIRDLLTGTKRFSELMRSVSGITQKVLKPSAQYGGGRASHQEGVPGSSAQSGIYPHGNGIQSETDSGFHGDLGDKL